MNGPLPRPVVFALSLGVLGILATQSLIDLELAWDLGPWHLNAPVADLLALGLLPLALISWLRDRTPLPGPWGYALFLVACALSIGHALLPETALHHLLRKPLFLYLAYGLGLSHLVARRVPLGVLSWGLVAWLGGTALLSLATSALRLLAGNALWFEAIAWVTNNHKTLAVAMAGGLPLVLGLATAPGPVRRPARLACLLALAAIALSASKTAWITTALALALFWPARRPLGLRPRLVLPALLLSMLLAYYAPVLMGSKTMLDAARSRHSLNHRAEVMFRAHPLVGSGTGMNVHIELVSFPHYRVNGVDAHGVVQKLGSETGLLGLAGYGFFVLATGATMRRRWTGSARGLTHGALGTWCTLHANLLLSTETFSPTHWVPLAVAWGLVHRPDLAGPDDGVDVGKERAA